MRTQAVKLFASLLVIAGFSSVALNAQPTVKSVGSVRHDTVTQVTVVFSDPVDPVSGATPGNYTFTGGVTVTGASMMTGLPAANAVGVAENPAPGGRVVDNQCVVLTVTGLAADATATITIQNVKDTATPPNTIASTTVTFKDSGYAWAESGTPALAGKVVAVGTNGFDIFSAGSGQWANYDEVVMVYKQVTGDFDLQARVEFQDFSSQWARAGVMARESLNEGENAATQQGNWCATPPKPGTASRYVDVHPNPVQCFNSGATTPVLTPGNNAWESHIRNGSYIGNNGGFQATDSANMTGGAPPYPNAWVRIQRVGNDFHTFHGSDGVNWDPAADRLEADFVDPATVVIDSSTTPCTGSGGDPLAMKPTLFVGPAFGPETVNIMPAEGQNRLFLYQVRFTAITVPYVRLVDPNPCGVLIFIEDAAPPGTQVVPSTVQLTFDGNPVTASATKSGTTTTVAYKAPAPFAPNSNHSISLTFKDNATPANSQKFDRNFTIPNYPTIPASYALAAPATNPGMNVGVYQMDAARGPGDVNSIVNAEQQWARGFIDPATGQPYGNTATSSSGTVNWVNWEMAGGDINVNPPQPDNFNSGSPASSPIPNDLIPGIPGSSTSPTDWIVADVVTYLQLNPGCYRMGVNSDDGFKVSVAPGADTPFGLVLGSFNSTRGAADTVFDFVVSAAGYYPFRLLWWQGTGGANVEWFTVNLDTGEKILVNHTNPNSVKAFRTGQGPAYVQSIVPANGFTGAQTNTQVKIVLVDGTTTVVDGSISLSIDGSQVTPTIVNGPTTTVTYNGAYPFVSSHTGILIWGESTTPQTMHTNNFAFTVRQQSPDDLPSYTAGSFWIEAEDFDATGTPVPAAVNTMPYDIGAAGAGPYDGIGATLNVDYFNNDNLDNTTPTTYRSTGDPNTAGRSVDLATDPNANFGERRPGAFDMTANYKIGWGDSADWYNYTRNIPAGIYTALVALSNGDSSAPAGTPDRMGGTLSIVTSGVGTPNQTLRQLGTFNGPSSGAWSYNNLVPMYAPDGSKAAFKITSATTTLRFSLREGDYDWFVLVPVTGVPPKVTTTSPANGGQVRRDATLSTTIEDFSTAVNASSVKLIFDGADVTSAATVNKNADITTVSYNPGLMNIGSSHSYSVIFSDNGAPALTQTNSVSFTVHVYPTAGSFVIEAEDFNHDGGQHVGIADTMPYLGGAYTNLGAVYLVDYNGNQGNNSTPYRPQLTNNVGHIVNENQNTKPGTLDLDRGTWQVTSNFKVGWSTAGTWYNYTRNIPTNTYQVWAALSHGDPAGTAHRLVGSLDVVSGDITTTNQTATALGVFDAPATGGWGVNALVPLQGPNTNGVTQVLSFGGLQTLRFYNDNGDFDYFVLVPAAAPPPSLRFNAPTLSGNTVNISWTGTATLLQEAGSLTGNPSDWINVATNPTTPFTVPIGTTARKFYRLKQ